MKRWLRAIILALICFGLIAIPASASIGIGLSCGFRFDLGSIQKKQTYHVGQMCILNTGTGAGWFRMNVSYLYQQPEMRVPEEWVKFTPETFWLNAGLTPQGGYYQQIVQIDLIIPAKARVGDYYSLLEGCTGTSIGVCVGAPLRFKVVR